MLAELVDIATTAGVLLIAAELVAERFCATSRVKYGNCENVSSPSAQLARYRIVYWQCTLFGIEKLLDVDYQRGGKAEATASSSGFPSSGTLGPFCNKTSNKSRPTWGIHCEECACTVCENSPRTRYCSDRLEPFLFWNQGKCCTQKVCMCVFVRYGHQKMQPVRSFVCIKKSEMEYLLGNDVNFRVYPHFFSVPPVFVAK